MEEIYEILLTANGFIFASPSYWFSPPGIMKNFIDRLTSLEVNGFLLEEKVFASISVAEESGGEEVSHYLASTMNEMGCILAPFSTFFINVHGRGSWAPKELETMGRNLVRMARAIKEKKINLI